jgi:hypothetical protein
MQRLALIVGAKRREAWKMKEKNVFPAEKALERT